MLKRPVSWGGTLLFIFISFAPLIFSALVIRYYSVNERTNLIKNRLNNSAEQVVLILQKSITEDFLKKSHLLAVNFNKAKNQNFKESGQSFLFQQWLLGSPIGGLILPDNSTGKRTVLNPAIPEKQVEKARAFSLRLFDSLVTDTLQESSYFLIKYFSGDSIPYIIFSVPLEPENVIVSFARISGLHKLFKKLVSENAVSLFLVDGEGNAECGSFNHKVDSISSRKLKNFVHNYFTANLNKSDFVNTIIEAEPEPGKKCLFLFKSVRDLNKVIVAVSPAVTFISAISHLYIETIVLFFLALLLAGLANYYAYTRIVRPVRRLTDAAWEVTKGNFDIKVEKTYNDEIGNLTRVFNKSIGQIRTFTQINFDKIIVERKKLEHIIEQLAGGILIVDPENTIIICNKIFADWYQLDVNTIVGEKLSAVEELKGYYDLIKKMSWDRSTEVIQKKVKLQLTKNTEQRVLDAAASNIFTSGKTFLATSIYIRDITKEHEVDKLKSELISTVAHELRSPLVSIIGFSEMLLAESKRGSQDEEYLEIINSESNRLANFVDQFLDLTRIESGSFPINQKEADMSKTVKQVVRLYESQAARKKIKIKTEFDVPLQVLKYDTELVERAIGNYLINAIKYSPEGSAIIVRSFLKENFFHLEVADNGPGISEDDLGKVFNKFYRITSKTGKQKKGSGLGLAFVKQVMEKHNGRVYVSSKLNEGSVFGLMFPLEQQFSDSEPEPDKY